MSKKVLSYTVILFFACIIAASTSKILMQKISAARDAAPWDAWWNTHPTLGGDLLRMSYLDNQEKFMELPSYKYVKTTDTAPRNIDFYLWGDSYVMYVPDSVFSHVNSFKFGRRDYFDLEYKLDKSKKNILMISLGERFVRQYLQHTDIFNHLKKADVDIATLPRTNKLDRTQKAMFGFPDIDISELFNNTINQNLEYNLFNYHLFTPIRKFKADINYKFFNRGSGNVVVSRDGEYLFLKETVSEESQSSSYAKISNQEIENITGHLNQMYDHYIADGFDAVYLAIIPNPASILQPENYNGLIPRLQSQHGLKMWVIDTYADFKSHPNPKELYRMGDTHWNNNGLNVWLTRTNNELKTWSAKN